MSFQNDQVGAASGVASDGLPRFNRSVMGETHQIKGQAASELIRRLFGAVSWEAWSDWRWQFANRLRSIDSLVGLLSISRSQIGHYQDLLEAYHWAITPYYLSLIDWSDPDDPVRRQCIPDLREIETGLEGSSEDPLAEEAHMPVPGLIHRYPDRALVIATGTCATYCRYCNRKRLWRLPGKGRSQVDLARIVDYVKRTADVREVIVSGGDPLTMNFSGLDGLLSTLKAVPHVEVLRIGTRVPVVMPMRITDELCATLARHRPLWVNTHFNHPREITPEAAAACDRLSRWGITVSNQTVLLRGVNDSLEVIRELCQGLQRIMVRPYYLFHCDAVRGTDHFRTDLWRGAEIMEGLWGRLGGLAIPNFVVDLPTGGGKVPLQRSYLLSVDGNEALFRTPEGKVVCYPNVRGWGQR